PRLRHGCGDCRTGRVPADRKRGSLEADRRVRALAGLVEVDMRSGPAPESRWEAELCYTANVATHQQQIRGQAARTPPPAPQGKPRGPVPVPAAAQGPARPPAPAP